MAPADMAVAASSRCWRADKSEHKMPIFAILSDPSKDAQLGEHIQKHYADDSLKVRSGQWLVFAPGTAKAVSDIIEISDGPAPPAMVMSVANYYGRANPGVWEWIKTKLDKGHG